MNRRKSGILLHVTSLPSPYGVGDLGPAAWAFVDFLARAGQSLWQILPLNPTDPSHGNSPYSSESAMAGNPLLISPELLVRDGWLDREELDRAPAFPAGKTDFEAVWAWKREIFRRAYVRFRNNLDVYRYRDFRAANADWLDDYALFAALKKHFHGAPWIDWPEAVRDRDPDELATLREKLADAVEYEAFLQYLFAEQWEELRRRCRQRGVQILGDMPIYVDLDSADVWADQRVFRLGGDGRPDVVAGVPPDYFSATGQLWGNPVYDWDHLRRTGFAWWMRRLDRNLDLLDYIRFDHFRGFVAYWEVPAGEKTAVGGRWVEAPAREFFETLLRRFPQLPIVAEDLGVITPDVREIMRAYDFPGMRVLAFAFGGDTPSNPYAPHNHAENCVVYTGTHDNNTIRGWFENETSADDRRRVYRYLGFWTDPHDKAAIPGDMAWHFVRLALGSVSRLAVVPMQDLLGLGQEARMNTPAVPRDNWTWRALSSHFSADLADSLRGLTELFGRL